MPDKKMLKGRYIKGRNIRTIRPQVSPEDDSKVGEMKARDGIRDLIDVRKQVDDLAKTLEKINLTEYITYLNNPRKVLLNNFGVGIMRGLGATVGATVVAGLLILFLKRLVVLNLPVIGGIIAELVKMVNANSMGQ